MMFKFRNKNVIILSPQKWGKMHISKHHYAIELAKMGNVIYFFNPPLRQFFPKIEIKKTNNFENLFIISYSFFFPYNIKFHFRKLYDILQLIQIKRILSKLKSVDVVWCFDTSGFSNLRIFNGKITVYHPVDNISGKNQKELLQTSDFVFSVSDVIINDLRKINNKKKYFINHGLSKFFVDNIIDINTKNKKDQKYAYFVGNVLLSSLDRQITKKIIIENNNIKFIFIGSYEHKNNNIGGAKDIEAEEFVMFLKKQNNVLLKGSLHPKKVVEELQNADILLVLIDTQKDINKGSNSHKILEYLSTGKVIVANHVSTYADKRHLIEMVDEMHNEELPALFKKVISNLDFYNRPELQKKRKKFALDNTYEKQIKRIEQIISEQNSD